MSVCVTTLENGVRVATETRRSIETAAIGVWVDVGARFESAPENGITHCLEHMLFKGTKSRTARQIAEEIEARGGHMNAYTSREHTTYYARILKEDVTLALEILGDILQNSLLDAGELEREKDVILQELGQAHDTPDDIIFDYLQAEAFRGHALGRSILGTEESVRALTSEGLRDFLASQYTGGSIVISAVGNLEHDAVVTEARRLFGALPPGHKPEVAPAAFTQGTKLEVRDLEQVHVALAWPGVEFGDADYYALQVYSALMGGGMSSRLFQEVREERGLAYSIYSFASSHAETGLFGVYGGTSPELAAEMVQVIAAEIMAAPTSISEEEIRLGKAQLKAGLLMGMEATTSRMEQIGRHMLIFGRPLTTDEMTKGVDDVSLSDVKRVATRIAEFGEPTMVGLGGGDLTKISWRQG